MSSPLPPTEPVLPELAADDARLHAFVDGQLPPDERVAVLVQLRNDPAAAARVAAWQAQRQALRGLARDWPLGDTPPELSGIVLRAAAAQRWHRHLPQALAASLLLTLGAVGGYQWGRHDAGTAVASAWPAAPFTSHVASVPEFARQAGVAFAVYSAEKRHPVEVSAAEQAHLVQWLSKRLGRPLTVPVLTDRGYALLGGRLLPGDASQPGSPRAQFMYENADGDRLTLYVAVFAPGATPAGAEFRLLQQDGRTTLYWADGEFGYALSAQPSVQLQPLAQRVHEQLAG